MNCRTMRTSVLMCSSCLRRLSVYIGGRCTRLDNLYCQHYRLLAMVPSRGPDFRVTGKCSVKDGAHEPALVRRSVPLCPSIRLANRSTDDLLAEFISFFRSNRHSIVSPSSVYPKRHEGSYFVNAGMNQFKPLFLGAANARTSSSFDTLSRAVNCQPCIRVGGRHDDLNDVGYDGQHHTMFEMLGNWSFGDYYKTEACRLMWTFARQVLNLPTNALYVTYFGGCPKLGLPADNETRNIWLSLGVLDQKLMPFGVEYNFWRAGQSSGGGLCGPATEIHVDFEALGGNEDLRCARCLINTTNPHIVELWNCVFITHRIRPPDGSSDTELLEPLSRHFVDTGMGLERLAAVMQGVTSTYDSDRFKTLLDRVHAESTTSQHSPPVYGGCFLPTLGQLDLLAPSNSPDEIKDNFEPVEADDHLSAALSNRGLIHRRTGILSTLWQRLGVAAPEGVDSQRHCHASDLVKRPAKQLTQFSMTSGDEEVDQLLANWRRDVAYRLLVDHSRALALTLSDGLLPGRQGLALKLRQLIQRATRAALLTGLEDLGCRGGRQSVLASMVGHLAQQHREKVLLSVKDSSVVSGPSARAVSQLSPSDIGAIVDREVKLFLPRVDDLEKAFHQCLQEPTGEDAHRLSGSQVRGLMTGRYGVQVSWDLICAQSHWAGLALPMLPSPADAPPNPGGLPNHRVKGALDKKTTHHLSSLLHQAGVPHSDDSGKYSVNRRVVTANNEKTVLAQDLYDFPDCHSHLVGILLPDPKDIGGEKAEQILISRMSATSVRWPDGAYAGAVKLGLVFSSTNFFSPSGGQDGDSGWVKCCLPIGSSSDTILAVEEVEYVPSASPPDSQSSSVAPIAGWVVHWIALEEGRGSGYLVNSLVNSLHHSGDPVYRLTVDQKRRFGLMLHHTGQHLFTWALSAVAADHVVTPHTANSSPDSPHADGDRGTHSSLVQHYGGTVRPDHFTLRVSLPSSLSDWLQDNVVDFVRHVEAKCRQAIASQLPIAALQVTWDEVAKNPAIRRFAWNDYTHHVTAVCIGGRIPHAFDNIGGNSAELCGGTHLLNTVDLEELTVLSVRSRRQPVKQFTVLTGQSARMSRLRGDQLLLEATGMSTSEQSTPPTINLPLPLVVRELMTSPGNVLPKDEPSIGDSLTQQIFARLQGNKASSSVVIIGMPSGTLPRMELPVNSLLQLSPNLPIIIHSGQVALCYFPQTWTLSALDSAHSLARQLSVTLAHQFLPLLVKARPVRVTGLTGLDRYRFALLQLLPATSDTSSGTPEWSQLPEDLLPRETAILVEQLLLKQSSVHQ